jgi:KaiC/GvpD/RAD55 family RecA-like ATPase
MPAPAALSSIGEGEIVLVFTTAEDYVKTTTEVMRMMITERKNDCLYVTVNRPYNVMVKLLKERGIDTGKIFFIDLISRMLRVDAKAEDCLFIDSPESLTELSIAIAESIKNMPGSRKFMFLDSLSTLLVYNQAGTVTKFAHFLSNKMKTEGVETIIMVLEKEMDEMMSSQIQMFADKVIKVNGE